MASYNRYQYETSPRKLEPEYKTPKKKKLDTKRNKKVKANSKIEVKLSKKIKLVLYLLVAFSVLFAISYRNSKINEEFSEARSLMAFSKAAILSSILNFK